MNYTNRHNLPPALARLLELPERPVEPDVVHVTDLAGSMRIAILKRRHALETIKDVADMFWMFNGNVVHSLLAKTEGDDEFVEEKVTHRLGKYTLSGTADKHKGVGIVDWKYTSVWAYVFGGYDEWEPQLNVYNYMWLKEMGFSAEYLEDWLVLRDWSESRAETDSTYPKVFFQKLSQPIWTSDVTEKYLETRLATFDLCMNMADDELPPCTSNQMWQRDESYAVMKKGNKKASKLFKVEGNKNAEEEAKAHVEIQKKPGDYEVEYRPGDRVRCRRNACGVASWCNLCPKKEESDGKG